VKRLQLLGRRVFIVLGLLFMVLLVMDFNRRMAELARLSAQFENESLEITTIAETQVYLETQIAYATSAPAVEAWARENGRWARSGDFPVVPLPDPNFTPESGAPAFRVDDGLSNWQAWIMWFFNRTP
jgi:hypothetical protein